MRKGGSGFGGLSLSTQASAPLRRKSTTEVQYSVTGGSSKTSSVQSTATSPVGLASGLLEAPGSFDPGSKLKSPSGASTAGAIGGTVGGPAALGGAVGKTSNESWVCPDDRQLALRAKLKSGWSIKTANLNQWKQRDPLSEEEHQKLLGVISQAEQHEKAEQERVGHLIDRLECLRQSRLGNGDTDCILCGEVFSFFIRSQRRCVECAKLTCSKCGLETKALPGPGQSKPMGNGGGGQTLQHKSSSVTSLLSAVVGVSNTANVELIWLCKICHEQREIWKKSGAWFFKSMPKYVLPEGSRCQSYTRFSQFTADSSSQSIDNLGSVSAKEDGEVPSEEEGQLANSFFRKSFRGSISAVSGVFANSIKKRASYGSEDLPSEDDCSLASTTISLPPNIDYNNDPDGSQSSRSRPLYHDYPLYEEVRSSSVPPVLMNKHHGSTNGHSRTESPHCYRIGRTPNPSGVPRPPHWQPRPLSSRFCRPPMGFPTQGPNPSCSPSNPQQPWSYPFPTQPPFRSPNMKSGMRFRRPPQCPPRFRHPYPSQTLSSTYHSTLQSPVMSKKFTEQEIHSGFVPQTVSDLEYTPNSEEIFQGSILYNDEMYSVRITQSPSSHQDNLALGQAEVGDEAILSKSLPGHQLVESDEDKNSPDDRDEERELPKAFQKAKPFGERKENKFTSTLRRLSTIRRKSKNKRKEIKDKTDNHENSSAEFSSTPPLPFMHLSDVVRKTPSTTSRDSEGEALTSGYFSRQESQSHGSDETLSPPRSPEGSHGLIEFSLVYNEVEEHLMVNVIKAKKIRGADFNGLADSYCKITLTPPLPNRAISQQITKTIAKSINPHFNAMLHFISIDRDTLSKTSLHAAIFDEDLAGDLLLSEAKFPLRRIMPQMQKKFQVVLEKPDLKDTFDGLILNSNVGAVEVSLAFFSKQGTLKVGVKRCINLQPVKGNHTANPLIQVALLPSNKKSNTQRTTVKWNSLSPEYHEQFVFLSSFTELPKQSLHLTVWDKMKGAPDEYMGGIVLGLGSKSVRLQHWIDMMKTMSQFHTKTHFLSANYIG